MTARPVFLSSLGIVSALGHGTVDVAKNLFSGDQKGMRRRDDLLIDGRSTVVGEVSGELPPVQDALRAYRSRNFQMVIAAVEQMREELDGAIEKYGPARVGVVMGSSTSGIDEGEKALTEEVATGTFPSSYDIRMQELGSVAEGLALYLGLGGPAYTISTACSSGTHALSTGKRMLESGIVDAVVVGGADTLCRLTLNGFQALSALSYELCLPFSKNRRGINIGEGAAIFLMQREEADVALWGVGSSSDGYSMTSPQPEGEGVEIALHAALTDAGCEAREINYVQMHGTGTDQNDRMESSIIARLFDHDVPASSSKAQIGHALGAAGAMGAAHCWLAAHPTNEAGYLPPHMWDGVAEDGMLNETLVRPGDRMSAGSRPLFLSNAFAFGGNNACLVIGRAA
ncbi:MAG TPA: beta-ketoacyl-[acyl-carrier-protein] synthase II [Rhodobiaceae bacterium]|nr:beta-ketoacyl-[acyl-carrier-protein] synthase II [Rhodobiaceae bacterium]|tara:strand:+ start:2335 stop:3534 length:1200 start_codon:yes stop_codon:yes gene_type:complete